MAARDDGKDDHELHACLLCELSHMLVEDDLKNLKQVLKSAGKIPAEKLKKVTNFYELWNVLEQNGYVSEGKYGVLIEYLERMKINICVIKIKEYIKKIEEYRARKSQTSLKENTDGLSESRTRQMVNDMVASALQQFGDRISSKIDERINNTLEMKDDGSSGKLEDRITAKLEDRMKTETKITEERVNVMMKTTADELSAKIANIVNKEVSQKLSAKAQPSTPAVVKAAVNRLGMDGKTLLISAAEKGDIVDVNSLLHTGADPDLKDKKDGWTALMHASHYGHKESVALLLENSADVNLQSVDGFTALILASRIFHKGIVALLLENSADVNLQSKGGETALIFASVAGRKEIVALLLEKNANVNLKNKHGETALSWAKKHGRGDIVKMLKAAGAK